jgi:hypothetical protein
MPGTSSGGTPIPLDTDVAGDLALAVRNAIDSLEAAWVAYTPTLINLTVGNGTVVARGKRIGKTIFFSFHFTLGSTSAVALSPQFTLPYTPRETTFRIPFTSHYYDAGVANYLGGALRDTPANPTRVTLVTAAGAPVAAGTPFAFGTGDQIFVTGTYEAV